MHGVTHLHHNNMPRHRGNTLVGGGLDQWAMDMKHMRRMTTDNPTTFM